MVLFLNYLPYIIAALAAWFIWRAMKKHKEDTEKMLHRILEILLLLVITEVALVAVGNTYVPRGTVESLQNPAFEESSAQMQDKLRKPAMTSDQSEGKLKELSDWRKHKQEREENSNDR